MLSKNFGGQIFNKKTLLSGKNIFKIEILSLPVRSGVRSGGASFHSERPPNFIRHNELMIESY